jgi:hypothetical protein
MTEQTGPGNDLEAGPPGEPRDRSYEDLIQRYESGQKARDEAEQAEFGHLAACADEPAEGNVRPGGQEMADRPATEAEAEEARARLQSLLDTPGASETDILNAESAYGLAAADVLAVRDADALAAMGPESVMPAGYEGPCCGYPSPGPATGHHLGMELEAGS